MRFPIKRFRNRDLAVVAAVTAVLVGGWIFLLRESASTRPSAPPRPKNRSVIMEGVDINSNGPGHPWPAPPLGEQRPLLPGQDLRLPPDLLSDDVR